jgi:hypothetical protein
VASNTIDLDINGVVMTQEIFATDHATTIAAVAAQIVTDFSEVLSASASGRVITVVPA